MLSVSVKGAMECHMRVNDAFCAVSSSGTMQSAAKRHSKRLGDLLHAHALSCHLLDGEKSAEKTIHQLLHDNCSNGASRRHRPGQSTAAM